MKLQVFFALFFCLLITSYAQTETNVNTETGETTVTAETPEGEVTSVVDNETGEVTTTVESPTGQTTTTVSGENEEVNITVESGANTEAIPNTGEVNNPETSQAPGSLPGQTAGVTQPQTAATEAGGLSGSIVTPLVGVISLVAAYIIA